MDPLAFTFSSGWGSGINAYAVVLLMGLLGRFADVGSVPDALTRSDVLIAAAAMYAVEFVADKIPYVDTLWDAIHTVIRPLVGAGIGALIAGDANDLVGAYAAVGGTTALISHGVKASVRMAINTSPEPMTNITASVAEDFGVAGVITLAVFHPLLAAVIALVLLILGVVLVLLIAKRVRHFIGARLRGSEP